MKSLPLILLTAAALVAFLGAVFARSLLIYLIPALPIFWLLRKVDYPEHLFGRNGRVRTLQARKSA